MSETNTSTPALPAVPNLDSAAPDVVNDNNHVDLSRISNEGKKVTLKNGKTFTVRELGITSIISLIGSSLEIFQDLIDLHISQEKEEKAFDQYIFLAKVTSDPLFKTQLINIVAALISSEPKEFLVNGDILPSDFFKIYNAAKEVVDFEELKESFFETGLQKYLQISPISTETNKTLDQ
jgi:hypothetical protein